MGINISGDNFVAHDQTHEKRVNTSLDANPTSKKLGGVTVHHVFRRNKTGDLDRDGNPLIYALKGMGGYNIVAMYRTQIMARAREILEKCTELQGTVSGDGHAVSGLRVSQEKDRSRDAGAVRRQYS